jgi:hypothetical protein
MSKKYVIIHGHFYQPPRENPWIGLIETQKSAAPYHDWNERVYAECYRPNAHSRLLDQHGAILDIHNNYAMMSYNFGPTLFSWLERYHSRTARNIIEADRASCARLEGHGNAIAQVFNHIIMPLASHRDQITQIRWARAFFRERFNREPEGIWLAETAINMETVRCLIEENIKFVVLSPAQIEAIRPLEGNGAWTTAQHGVDTRHAYRIHGTDRDGKATGGFVDAFFFDQGLSREASFGDLLKDAQTFGQRINGAFAHHASGDQAVILASDGETFGHHKAFGDMCLAYFFRKIAPKLDIIPVNFGYFLAHNPPRQEVQLKDAFGEGTAWSCAHGVGRWTRNCGCKTGGDASWQQTWRSPLRRAMQTLQARVDAGFEAAFSAAGLDPWKLRNEYIRVMDNPSMQAFLDFLGTKPGGAPFSRDEVFTFRKLLEAQKFMLYAFTSCAWFFSDIGGIEAMQNLAYAARSLQMGIPPAQRVQASEEFLAILEQAAGNVGGATGRSLFEKNIEPFINHEAILSFTAAVERSINLARSDRQRLFGYDILMRSSFSAKKGLLSYHGYAVSIENAVTGEQCRSAVLISHRNKAEVQGWVIPETGHPADGADALSVEENPEAWINHPLASTFTLTDIFKTSRENMAEYVHRNIFEDTFEKYSAWMHRNERELDLLSRLDFPLPLYCLAPLDFVYNQQWNHYIRRLERRGGEEEIAAGIRDLCVQLDRFKIVPDLKESAALIERIITRELAVLAATPASAICKRIGLLLDIVDRYKMPVSKHTLEDSFAPIMAGPVKSLNDEVEKLWSKTSLSVQERKSFEEKKTLLGSLIEFAARMNFNTDLFQGRGGQ